MRRRRADEQGITMVWMTISLTALLAVSALAIDIGYGRNRDSDAQRAADAAALAGSLYLTNASGESVAEKVARTVAEQNGYIDGVNGATVDVAFVNGGSELQVTISHTSAAFFGGIAGPSDYKITAIGTARYAPPAPMGSPGNVFGNEPVPFRTNDASPSYPTTVRSGGNPTPGFWANINGPATGKDKGDPIAGKNCDAPRETAVGTHFCPDNPESDHAYTFVINKKNVNDTVRVELFDPAFTRQSSPGVCDNSRSGRFTPSTVADPRFVAAGTANPRCTGDDSMQYRNFAYLRNNASSPSCPGGGVGTRILEGDVPIGPPEHFEPQSTKVKGVNYEPAPAAVINQYDTQSCTGTDFPITSFWLYDTDRKSLICGPVTWDPAPSESVWSIDNPGTQYDEQIPKIGGPGDAVQPYNPASTDYRTATSINRERQRIYAELTGSNGGRNDAGVQFTAPSYDRMFNYGAGANPAAPLTVRLPGEQSAGHGVGRPDLTASGAPFWNLWTKTRDHVNRSYRDWVRMPSGCELGSGRVGRYYLVARTDTYVDSMRYADGSLTGASMNGAHANQYHNDTELEVNPNEQGKWRRGAGANSFALRAFVGNGNSPSNNRRVEVFAEGRQDIFTQLGGNANSYISRVVPAASPRELTISMFDIGDGYPTGTVGPYTLDLFKGDDSGDPEDNGITTCSATLTLAAGGTKAIPGASGTNSCRLSLVGSETVGQLLTISVPISTSYSCSSSDQFECWIMGKFDFGGATRVSDATMWAASIDGEPSRITG